ncbi:MAG TPA: Zn-dependent hydrolase [Thermoanaerobaculia bacterium]|nr:Zn-dependent hydrolase [Thermoanaerobaculia bacterium]
MDTSATFRIPAATRHHRRRAAAAVMLGAAALASTSPAASRAAAPAGRLSSKPQAPVAETTETAETVPWPMLSAADAAPDLERRLAKWKAVPMPFSAAGLSARERQMVDKLVEACRWLERIYWRQSDPEGLALYGTLTAAKAPAERDRELRRLLWINGSHFDLLDENRPFVGREPMPPGRALYPRGLTRQQIEAFVAADPARKKAIYDEHSVILSAGGGALATQPYHVAYGAWLNPAARALREAAALAGEPAFASFLRLRADALLSDDYFQSDLAWLDLVNPKFDLIFAPYETYLDDLLGVKTSYGAAVLIRNETESAKLAVFQKYVADIQEALPLAQEDRPSKRGRVAPMEVMDAPFRAGDLRHGYQAVADNLPNDPRVHELKGSKRIFFKNFMDARVDHVILPLARRLMRADQAAKASAEGYLAAVMMHEISHGLGPTYARRGGQRVDIREAIGPAYSGLEEAKADVTGIFGLAWLIDRGALPKERLEEYYASYVAGIFRTVRFGTGEAHGRAEMMELNYLAEQGALRRAAASGRYEIDYAKLPAALAALTREVLQTEATGDRARAEAWFKKYGAMPAGLQSDLAATADIPVDLDPQGSIPEGVE